MEYDYGWNLWEFDQALEQMLPCDASTSASSVILETSNSRAANSKAADLHPGSDTCSVTRGELSDSDSTSWCCSLVKNIFKKITAGN